MLLARFHKMHRCVLELHAIAAKKMEVGGSFAVAMTSKERRRFLHCIQEDFEEYYDMLGSVNAETSDCTRREERDNIHAGIRGSIGFGRLNRMLFGVLEEWMKEQLEDQILTCEQAGDEIQATKWMMSLSHLLSRMGRQVAALEIQEKLLEAFHRVLPDDDPDIGDGHALYRACIAFHM